MGELTREEIKVEVSADDRQSDNLRKYLEAKMRSLPEHHAYPNGAPKYREISIVDYSTLLALALEALDQREQGGWQDISSAPKDGTSIQFSSGYMGRYECYPEVFRYYDKSWWNLNTANESQNADKFYTHWRPLPTPPQEQEG